MSLRDPDLFGPILVWEMTTVGRRARYFFLRVAYCLFLGVLLWSVFQSTLAQNYLYGLNESMIRRSAAFATGFFTTFSYAQISAILFLTPAYVASSIVIEKERKTIEYLFASTLTNREIVLGKWSARSLNLLMLVLAGIPVLSFASFFGGIGLDRVFLLAVLSVGTLVLVSGLSIVVSVYGRTMRSTLSNTYSAIILGLVLPILVSELGVAFCQWLIAEKVLPGIDYLLLEAAQVAGAALYSIHPYFAVAWLYEADPNSNVAWYVFMVAGIHIAIGSLFLAIATWRIRAAYRAQVSRSDATPRTVLRRRRKRRSAPEIKDNPMAWKEWHFGGTRQISLFGKILFPFLIVGAYWYLVTAAYYHFTTDAEFFSPYDVNVYIRTVGTLAAGLTLMIVASRSATCFGTERDKDTWLSLLSTPLSGSEIVAGKFWGSMKPVVFFLVLMAPAWALGVLMDGLSIAAIPAVVVAVLAYTTFVASLGVYQSLRRQTTASALAVTFLICAILGGVGHMLSGLFFFPLMVLGIESEALFMLYGTSLPWVVLGSVPFRSDDLMGDTSMYVGCILFWMMAYCVATAFLYQMSIANFERLAPRLDLTSPPKPGRFPASAVPPGLPPASPPALEP